MKSKKIKKNDKCNDNLVDYSINLLKKKDSID